MTHRLILLVAITFAAAGTGLIPQHPAASPAATAPARGAALCRAAGNLVKAGTPPRTQEKRIGALVRNGFTNPTALVELYNSFATSPAAQDYGVAFTGTTMLPYVKQFIGERTVIFFSVRDIENNLQNLRREGVTIVGYDLENGYSPADEVSDPINSIRRAADVAHRNGFKFWASVVNIPGYNILDIVRQTAAYMDIYTPQGQSFQQYGPDYYARRVSEAVNIARSANPNITIITQVSLLRGDVANCEQSFAKLNELSPVEGVMVFYGLDANTELPKLKEFYTWFAERYRQ